MIRPLLLFLPFLSFVNFSARVEKLDWHTHAERESGGTAAATVANATPTTSNKEVE
jgi:hypothetical protein